MIRCLQRRVSTIWSLTLLFRSQLSCTFMHPQRWLIRYLQRRVSWWLAIWSLNLLFRSQFSCTLNADCFKILISARFFNAEWVSATVENARLFMTGDLVTHSVVSISIIMHPQRWLLQNINLIKVYDSISSSISNAEWVWETVENRDVIVVSSSPNVRIGTSLLSQVHPLFIVVCWVWYRFNILRMLFYPI